MVKYSKKEMQLIPDSEEKNSITWYVEGRIRVLKEEDSCWKFIRRLPWFGDTSCISVFKCDLILSAIEYELDYKQ